MQRTIIEALAGAILLGAVSTLGDLIWKWFALSHQVETGVIHGALVLLAVGVFLGIVSGQTGAVRKGSLGGLLIGVAAAGVFYLFAPFLGFRAAFLAWAFFWVALAFLQQRLGVGPANAWDAMLRGIAAGILSGAAFYMISGIWFGPNAYQTPAIVNLAYWTFAFFPGFLILRWGQATRAQSH